MTQLFYENKFHRGNCTVRAASAISRGKISCLARLEARPLFHAALPLSLSLSLYCRLYYIHLSSNILTKLIS